jgi:periplasmic protein TonB
VATGHPVADVLRLLADCDSTGALQVTGPPRGVFYLEQGRVVAVETDAVPRGTTRAAVLDAAAALLQRPSGMPPRFTSGARLETAPTTRWEVAQVLTDVDRALDRLASIGVAADDSVVVRPLAGRGVTVDATTWPLLGLLAVPRTPRQIAWALGRPVVDTVLAIGGLVQQGAVDVVRTAPPPARPAPPPAAERTRPPAPDRTVIDVAAVIEEATAVAVGRRPPPARDARPGREVVPEPAPFPAPSATGPTPAPTPAPAAVPAATVPARARRSPVTNPIGLPVRRPGVALDDAVRHARNSPARGQHAVAPQVRVAQPEAELVIRLLEGLRRL